LDLGEGEGSAAEMVRASMIVKLMCVGLVATVMMPVGRELYPYVAGVMDTMKFDAFEALLSATLGYALYAALFG
jgi:hypothetical protein